MPAKDLIGLAVAGAHASSKLDVARMVTKLEVARTLAKLQGASLAEAATATRLKTILKALSSYPDAVHVRARHEPFNSRAPRSTPIL